MTDETAQAWRSLLELDVEERISTMVAEFRSLAQMDAQQRLEGLSARAAAEVELDDSELTALAEARVRAWLLLGDEDRDAAAAIIGQYEDVQNELPAGAAMRRATVMQRVAKSSLTAEEGQRLVELAPGIERQLGLTSSALRKRFEDPSSYRPRERRTRRLSLARVSAAFKRVLGRGASVAR